MTAIPLIKWQDTGVVAPTEPAILTGALTDFKNAFGGDLSTNLETPQGQLSSSLTNIIGEFNDTILQLVNQVDPKFASGFMQDALGHIYFLDRKPALPTTVDVDCTGAVGTVIPVGAKVRDISGNLYQCTSGGTIDSTGIISLPFENIVVGDVPCPANTVTTIYQTILGWSSCNNPLDGTLGRPVESRADFEQRRNDSVFLGSQGSLDSAYAAVFDVANVVDVYAQANLTTSDITVGSTSYVIPAGASYIAVRGGNSNSIAKAIYSKLLAKLVGDTVVNVMNGAGTNATAITFQRPTSLAIKFDVDIKNSASLPANIVDLVQAAIVSAFNGKDGGERARIGQTIYASRFYCPVGAIDSSVKTINIKVGTTTANLDSIDVGIDEYPTISKTNITVNLI